MSFNGNVILYRPKDTEITISVLCSTDYDIQIEYGTTASYGSVSSIVSCSNGVSEEFILSSLSSSTEYHCRINYRVGTSGPFNNGDDMEFRTRSDPCIKECEPRKVVRGTGTFKITGHGFGTTGVIYIDNRIFSETHSKIQSWTDTQIDMTCPSFNDAKFPGESTEIERDLTVTSEDGDVSNVVVITILKN